MQKEKELMLYFIDKAIEQEFKNAESKTQLKNLYRKTVQIPEILRKAQLNLKLKHITQG